MPCEIDRGRSSAKREQWPLNYWVASTIHKILCETCGKLATQKSDSDKTYQLWEKNMLLVLLSRTRSMRDLYFVAESGIESTLSAMTSLLIRKNPTGELIDATLSSVNAIAERRGVVETAYVHLSVEIPRSDIGFVYLLVSCRDASIAYVGETNNIYRRIAEHNSGHGSRFTAQPGLAPFALLALVHGFAGDAGSQDPAAVSLNSQARRSFEVLWHRAIGDARTRFGGRILNAAEVQAAGRVVFEQQRRRTSNLQWLQCARPTRIRN